MDSVHTITLRERLLAWADKWTPLLDLVVPSLFSALILVAVIAQAFIYNAQRVIMNDQLLAMNNQLKAMNEQRVVMNDQLAVMEKGLRLSERAYVGIASLEPNLEGREIIVTLENIGKIPANKVSLQAQEYRWVEEKKEGRHSTTDFDAGQVQLFPGSFKMRIPISLSDFKREEIQAINQKREILAIGGTIRYEDGFGDTDATYFAFEYEPTAKAGWIARSNIVEVIKRHEAAK